MMRNEYFKQWHAGHDPQPGKEPIRERTVYRGHDWDDMRPHLQVFFQVVSHENRSWKMRCLGTTPLSRATWPTSRISGRSP
jgi:hypothetical protein